MQFNSDGDFGPWQRHPTHYHFNHVECFCTKDGTICLKMRLPKAETEKLMWESKIATKAAARL
ncbi:hypothetical protein B296_00015624 [Ensete ventricosum]|uniref:Uncharacterized protein n=1 Tax=Ensete ventricosum TaxID=4639 RepID=A0A427B3Z6_ENSVE|nr:hypothetical protein B296_00015624 [Ensete ventricosum]